MWLTTFLKRLRLLGSDPQIAELIAVTREQNELLRLSLVQQGVAVPPVPPRSSVVLNKPRKRLATDVQVITREMIWEQEQKAAADEQKRREGRLPS